MNPITVLSQLISEAQLSFGAVERIDVPESLWEQGMDAVADAGGEVGIDYFVVDGVTVRPLAEAPDEAQALVHVAGSDEPQYLTMGA